MLLLHTPNNERISGCHLTVSSWSVLLRERSEAQTQTQVSGRAWDGSLHPTCRAGNCFAACDPFPGSLKSARGVSLAPSLTRTCPPRSLLPSLPALEHEPVLGLGTDFL